MPLPVPSEDYTPPEDVLFEQVWDPSTMTPAAEGAPVPPDPDELVEEFAGAVSHDMVRVNFGVPTVVIGAEKGVMNGIIKIAYIVWFQPWVEQVEREKEWGL